MSKPYRKAIRLLATWLAMASFVLQSTAQTGGGRAELEQKLAALKQSVAANQQKLRKYQWTEVQQVTYKGEAKPERQFMCQYGPDGKVQKFPIGEQTQVSGGKIKQRIVAKKKDELEQYMSQVKSLLALYVPPDPQRMQAAFQAGKASVSREAAAGLVNFTFTDYAQPGDQMVLAFDTAAKKIANIKINTYLGEAKDAVTLAVDFSTLPDGTNFAEKTVLNVAAKQLIVTTMNTNYHPFGGA
jgi:hypothetical protein